MILSFLDMSSALKRSGGTFPLTSFNQRGCRAYLPSSAIYISRQSAGVKSKRSNNINQSRVNSLLFFLPFKRKRIPIGATGYDILLMQTHSGDKRNERNRG